MKVFGYITTTLAKNEKTTFRFLLACGYRSRALVRDYRWGSPASLYAFQGICAHPWLGSGLFLERIFPEFTRFFSGFIPESGPKDFRAALYH